VAAGERRTVCWREMDSNLWFLVGTTAKIVSHALLPSFEPANSLIRH
jgi:hypothetical protein